MNSIFHQNKGNNDKGVVFVIQFNQVSKSYEGGTKAVDSLHLEIKKENFCPYWSEWLWENNDNEND